MTGCVATFSNDVVRRGTVRRTPKTNQPDDHPRWLPRAQLADAFLPKAAFK